MLLYNGQTSLRLGVQVQYSVFVDVTQDSAVVRVVDLVASVRPLSRSQRVAVGLLQVINCCKSCLFCIPA